MIKVEDAISNLKNQILRFAEGTEPDLALKMAIKALEDSRWIPVTERLPDKEGFYLVTIPRHANKIVTEFYSTDGWGKRNSFGWEITAWMPLPQPYERSER